MRSFKIVKCIKSDIFILVTSQNLTDKEITKDRYLPSACLILFVSVAIKLEIQLCGLNLEFFIYILVLPID